MFEKLLITLPQKYQNYSTEFEKVNIDMIQSNNYKNKIKCILLKIKLLQVESGVSKVKPHWNRCTSLVTSYLYKPLGAVYAKTYFSKTDKDKVCITPC